MSNPFSSVDEPYITVVVFVYNHSASIESALHSILGQDYKNFEILILDDASTDESSRIIERFIDTCDSHVQIRFIRNITNCGFNRQVHRAVDEARGELIVEADGDDTSKPSRLKNISSAWVKNGKTEAFIYSAFYTVVDGKLESPPIIFDDNIVKLDLGVDLRNFSVPLTGATSAWTPGLIRKLAKYNSKIKHQDAILPIRALLLAGKVIYLSSREVNYTIEAGSLSRPVSTGIGSRVANNSAYWRGMIAVFNQYSVDRSVVWGENATLRPRFESCLDRRVRALKGAYLVRYACLRMPLLSVLLGIVSRRNRWCYFSCFVRVGLLKVIAAIQG